MKTVAMALTALALTSGAALAGSGTTPGVGVPTVLVSGRLAAERITGAPTAAARHTETSRVEVRHG